MLTWFKNLFNTKQVEEHHEEDVKDISEPAISLLKCVQDNPERFMCDKKKSKYHCQHTIRLYDKKENIILKADIYYVEVTYYGTHTVVSEAFSKTDVFTQDEVEYLYKGIKQVYGDIVKEKEDTERVEKRKRLSGIYCK